MVSKTLGHASHSAHCKHLSASTNPVMVTQARQQDPSAEPLSYPDQNNAAAPLRMSLPWAGLTPSADSGERKEKGRKGRGGPPLPPGTSSAHGTLRGPAGERLLPQDLRTNPAAAAAAPVSPMRSSASCIDNCCFSSSTSFSPLFTAYLGIKSFVLHITALTVN